MNNPKEKIPGGVEQPSRIDLLTGKHTKDILVAILIIIILLVISFGNLENSFQDRLFDGFLALIGFFAGSKIK